MSVLPCGTNWASSLARIGAFAPLIVCCGCCCDGHGFGGGKRWCWSSRPPSTVGIAKGPVDAGAVARGSPGRPRIDSTCRDLIRRLAAENHLWGAPRIHGELLKLGIAVSERTVSRYLQGRPTARSQTWRTFFANHLGDLAFMPPVMSSSAPGDDDVVDASGLSFHPVPLSLDGLCAANQWAVVDWSGSRRPTLPGWRLAKDHVHDRTGARTPHRPGPAAASAIATGRRRAGRGSSSMPTSGLCDQQPRETIRCTGREIAIGSSESLPVCNRVVNVAGRPERLRSDAMHVCVIDSHVGGNIGEAQVSIRGLGIRFSPHLELVQVFRGDLAFAQPVKEMVAERGRQTAPPDSGHYSPKVMTASSSLRRVCSSASRERARRSASSMKRFRSCC